MCLYGAAPQARAFVLLQHKYVNYNTGIVPNSALWYWNDTLLHCTALYCTVLQCTALYSTVLHFDTMYYTVQHELYSTVFYNTTV